MWGGGGGRGSTAETIIIPSAETGGCFTIKFESQVRQAKVCDEYAQREGRGSYLIKQEFSLGRHEGVILIYEIYHDGGERDGGQTWQELGEGPWGEVESKI